MSPSRSSSSSGAACPSVLLLQVRDPDHEAARIQELECFRDLSGFAEPRLVAHNMVSDPPLTWADLEPHDVLLVGGAGRHSVTIDYPFSGPLAGLVRRWVGEGRAFLGSCWGHQFLAQALGGRVVTDPAGEEVGTFDVHLTEAGRRDPWLAGLPASFPVHLGHHDVVTELAPGMVELAYSDRGRNQVVRVGDLPVYGTQFHVEMTRERMAARLRMYAREYLAGEDVEADGGDAVDRRLRPTPEAEGLLCRFLAAASCPVPVPAPRTGRGAGA